MKSVTLRAVRQADDEYRLAAQPPDPRVDSARTYRRVEVEELAERLGAELRWVSPPTRTRNIDPWGGDLLPDDGP
jgi:hypothetical protein